MRRRSRHARRGIELAGQEQQLRDQQAELDRRRPPGRPGNSPAEKQVRAGLRAIAAERAELLAQISAQEAQLRPRQGEYARARGAAQAKGRKVPVSKAERKVIRLLAELQSERAYVDGTVHRARASARTDDAIWESCHDPETYGMGDW